MFESQTELDLRKQSVQGGLWAVLGAGGSAVAGFASFIVLSRMLGPKAYGLMAMVEASLALGQKLMASGLSEPLIQLPRPKPEHCDTIFWTLQVLALGLVAGMVGLSGPIGMYFREDRLPQLIAATSITLYFQATGLVPGALLARRFQFSDIARADIISEAVAGCVGVVMAFSGYGVWSIVCQRLVSGAVDTAVMWMRAGWRPQLRWSAACLNDVWQFSASRGLEGILQYIDQQGSRILLGRVAGATELGYFVFARRIVENSTKVLTSPIRSTAMSAFASIQGDLSRVCRIYAEGIALTASAVFPVSVGVAVVAPYVVPIMGGPGWTPSVFLLQLLMLSTFRQAFHLWNGALLRGVGKPQYLLVASFVRSTVILSLIFFLLPWGAKGTCTAILTGSFLSWPVAMIYVRRATGLSIVEQLRPGAAALISTAIMAAVLLLIRGPLDQHLGPIATIVSLVTAGVVVYTLSMLVVGRTELKSAAHNLNILLPGSSGS